jgi:hypothetical protein
MPIKYAIQKFEDDWTILTESGGVAVLYHNTEFWVSNYFQNRVKPTMDDEMWAILADGKMYVNDWDGQKDSPDAEMVLDALHWLHVAEPKFLEVDFELLQQTILNQ